MRNLTVALLTSLLALLVAVGAQADSGHISGSLYSWSAGVQTKSASGGGGSGGGRIVWFELRNLDGRLSWPSASALDDYRQMMATDPKAEARLAYTIGGGACHPQRRPPTGLSRLPLSSSSRACPLVENYCPPQFTPINWVGSDPYLSSTEGCQQHIASASAFTHWNEIHTASPAGGFATLDQVVAFNIKIWRQGQSTAFFERRVGLKTPDDDADPPSLRDTEWWYSGTRNAAGSDGIGGIFSNANLRAGPLAAMSASDWQRCQQRFDAAPKFYTYTDPETGKPRKYLNRAKWQTETRPQPIRSSQLGSGTYACYWSWPAHNGISPGSIYISWDIPNNALAEQPHLYYEITAAPGDFYAIAVAPLDPREQLTLPAADPGSDPNFWKAYVNDSNYFRVFVPLPANTVCCVPKRDPTTETTGTDEPELMSSVDVEGPVPTRVSATQTITTAPRYSLDDQQAVFPVEAQLLHFTPQLRYDGARGPSYPDEYARYDSDTGTRRTAPFLGPQYEHVDVAVLPQPAGDDDGAALSRNIFRTTWLRPTVENPCPPWAWSEAITNPWPTAPNMCSGPLRREVGPDVGESSLPRNAWDDAFTSSVLYEARWVASGSSVNRTALERQWLRCAGPLGRPVDVANGCEPVNQLAAYHGPHYTSSAGEEQHARGYLVVAGPSGRERRPYAGIQLTTNDASRVRTVELWNRDSGAAVDTGAGIHVNTITGHPSLWYCKPGLPAGAHIAQGSFGAADDAAVAAAAENDAPCRGFTAAWQWLWDESKAPYDSGDGSCRSDIAAPAAASFPAPEFASLPSSDRDRASSWGSYESYDGTPALSGNPDWSRLLREGGRTTIPYDGKRPGRGADYQQGHCYRTFDDGRYEPAGWVDSGRSVPRSIPDTSKPRPCEVPVYAGTGKKRKVVGCKTYGEWPTKVVHDPIYVFDFGNVCHPSNSRELALFDPAGRRALGTPAIITASDVQAAYDRRPGSPSADDQPHKIFETEWNDDLGKCSRRVDGFIQTGQWTIGRDAGRGWGVNQTGPRLSADRSDGSGYVVDWTFSGLTASELATGHGDVAGRPCSGVCWALSASYEGFDWTWRSRRQMTTPFQPTTTRYVAVYGFRGAG